MYNFPGLCWAEAAQRDSKGGGGEDTTVCEYGTAGNCLSLRDRQRQGVGRSSQTVSQRQRERLRQIDRDTERYRQTKTERDKKYLSGWEIWVCREAHLIETILYGIGETIPLLHGD